MLNKKFKEAYKKANFDLFRSIFLVSLVLVGTAYFMQKRVNVVMQKARDKRSLASGLEYFVRNFQFRVGNETPFKIDIFKKKAVIINYILETDEDSKKLFQSQLTMFESLKKGIVFLYIIDKTFDMKAFTGSKKFNTDNFIFVQDVNKSKDLLPIKKLPYSLIISDEHNLVGKVDGYQDWHTKEKIDFIKNVLNTGFSR